MTTIVAVQGEGWAVVGYDSRVTMVSDGGRYYTLPKSNAKLIKNGDYLIGTAGDLRIINILTYIFKAPIPPKSSVNLDKFMISVFVPSLKSCFEEQGIPTKESTGADILVVVRGKVYEIGENFEWSPDTNRMYAIGSGASYALGSLYTSMKKHTMTEAQASIRQALEVSASLDPYTGSPFSVISQKE